MKKNVLPFALVSGLLGCAAGSGGVDSRDAGAAIVVDELGLEDGPPVVVYGRQLLQFASS
jgi:hypothetical protein